MNEFDEVAESIGLNFDVLSDARAYCRQVWPDEGEQFLDNMAEAMLK